VGPAELPTHKYFKDLTRSETIGHSDIFPCLSHSGVSTDAVQPPSNNTDFESLEHSVYIGRRRLRRCERVAAGKYTAHETSCRPLGCFTKRTDGVPAFDRFTEQAGQ
jgi:hypothetical protein